ncbi:hypothetical protein B0H10DRAFT_1945148 [Mycena sp. CBHHK59/15]|nr:hypothetical protein B0H10DRAFT_1945148 [Mycena sp. CBHHK59/15]
MSQGSLPAPIHYVHNAPPEDHDLKRQYLALLPPQQVIEICLTLDIHVPSTLKRSIWPPDFRAVIASMQTLVPKLEDTPATIPAMASLNQAPHPSPAESQPPQSSGEPKPPDRHPSAGPSTQPVPPLQPYVFSAQPAYPHTPYYQALPPGYAPYSYPPYPPPPNVFPPVAFPPTPPPFPPPLDIRSTRPSSTLPHPQDAPIPPPMAPTDDHDLPSYEDMIVEGLTVAGDADGLAPKDLFNWMAARYPVQSNFRPSASQALQKAYKRGRFEKSTGGRYRLNANWEGGSSSTRRATRRPQTQNATPTASQKARAPATSPFTTAPRLLQPPAPPEAPTPRKGKGAAPLSKPPNPAPPPADPPAVSNDPYEAAQGILQAINFGGLFQLEDAATARATEPHVHVKSEAVPLSLAEHARAELQAQLALLAAQLEEIAQQEQEGEQAGGAGQDEEDDDDMEEVI